MNRTQRTKQPTLDIDTLAKLEAPMSRLRHAESTLLRSLRRHDLSVDLRHELHQDLKQVRRQFGEAGRQRNLYLRSCGIQRMVLP